MYAIIETGGRQFRVAEGDKIKVEKLNAEVGAEIAFDQVLAIVDGDKTQFGAPTVANASVKATVVEQGKHKKVIIFKYLPKKDFRKKKGHRQPYTAVRIDAITI